MAWQPRGMLEYLEKAFQQYKSGCSPDLADSSPVDQGTPPRVLTVVGWVALKVVRGVHHILHELDTLGVEWAPCIYCKGLVHYPVASSEMADCLHHLDCTYK
jgi:hypothetical protein